MKDFKLTEKGSDFYGVIAPKQKDTDYQLAGGILELPKPPFTFNDLKIQYNQNAVGRYACTLFGAMGCCSDLTGKVYSLQDQQSIYQQALTLGLQPNQGWYQTDAVDLVRKNHYRIFNQELITYQTLIGSDEFFNELDKGYTVDLVYSGNKEYNIDASDGTLDETALTGLSTYGHNVRIVKTDVDIYEMIVDNYVGVNSVNTYKLRKANIPDLGDVHGGHRPLRARGRPRPAAAQHRLRRAPQRQGQVHHHLPPPPHRHHPRAVPPARRHRRPRRPRAAPRPRALAHHQ